ncbi:MAG: phosphoglucosamine mutase [Coriobacteriia bacterium]|nr:phosphoglucosamine mutase [Coriobacteriia bacterium]
MSKKLFGTDGIRGVANTELPPELAFKLGRALVAILPAETFAAADGVMKSPRILIGRDTRRSGKMLEGALAAGITSAGADAILAGIVPTPTIAILLRDDRFDAGVVISASHNPPEYNGLKVFLGGGKKLSDAQQARIEELLHVDAIELPPLDDGRTSARESRPTGTALGRIETLSAAAEEYVTALVNLFPADALQGLHVAIDCGHGASHQTSPAAFETLGAQVSTINDDYSGDDINVGCGSTHLDKVAQCVQATGCDLGIAHDGDADRMLAVDETGATVDGDHIMAICAKYLKDIGQMDGLPVVGTVMANLGFSRALADMGIDVETTAVGDRYVLERMHSTGAVLGGEQSGHIIFLQHNSTGDGLLSALMLAYIVKKSGKPLSELAKVMDSYPQVLKNVYVSSKDIDSCDVLQAAIANAELRLGDTGRVLVRASGTEKLIRVMVEAADAIDAQTITDELAAIVAAELG